MVLLISTSCLASDLDLSDDSTKGHCTQTTTPVAAPALSQDEVQTAPKTFHFIWVGGNLPEKYLNNIYTCAARGAKDGYKVKVWVNKPSQFYQTAYKADRPMYKNIALKTIGTLIPFMKKEFTQVNQVLAFDDKVFENKSGLSASTEMMAYIQQEMVGKYNYSAVADWLRNIILLKEGGIYSDTDNKFQKEKDLEISGPGLSKIDLPHGVKFINPGAKDLGEMGSQKIGRFPSLDTNLVMAQPGNSLIRKSLFKFIENYKNNDFIERYDHPHAVQRKLACPPKTGEWGVIRSREGTNLFCIKTVEAFSKLDQKRAHGDLGGVGRPLWCSWMHSVMGFRDLICQECPGAVLQDIVFTSSQLGKITLHYDNTWHTKPTKFRYYFEEGHADIARTFR